MCRLLGVDRRRFYEWRARQAAGLSRRQQRAVELTTRIRGFHEASDGTYGAPRIHADLHDAGVVVSRKTVAKLMRADGIAGISPRTWHPPTTIRGENPFPVADLVERQFDQGERDRAWSRTSRICIPAKDGRTCVSCGMVTAAGSSGAPSQAAFTPISSRTRCARRSLCAATCRAR